MKIIILSSLLVMFAVGGATAACAEEDSLTPSPWKEKTTYGSQVASKAGFGLTNLALGWTELIQEPIEQKSPLGIVQGLGNAVMDTVGGFLHLLTAPLTDVDVPLPENGTNILKSA